MTKQAEHPEIVEWWAWFDWLTIPRGLHSDKGKGGGGELMGGTGSGTSTWDANYVYIKTAEGWKMAALGAW